MYLVKRITTARSRDTMSYTKLSSLRALGKARMPNNETARIVSLDYTLAAVRVFQDICQQPFRFIYCSGGAAERDQTKSLWFMQDYRRIRVCYLVQAVIDTY
jgi:hypothetical protein